MRARPTVAATVAGGGRVATAFKWAKLTADPLLAGYLQLAGAVTAPARPDWRGGGGCELGEPRAALVRSSDGHCG